MIGQIEKRRPTAGSVEPATGCGPTWRATRSPARWTPPGRHRPVRGRARLPGPPLARRYPIAGHHDTHGETCHRVQQAEPIVHGLLHPHSPRIFDARRAAAYAESGSRHPRRAYAMTMNARIKSFVRGVKYKAQEAEGRAKQTAGKATGNDRLRRKGKAEELRSGLNQFAKKIKDAIRR